MPFQAIPIAMRTNPGTPLSKLLWIYLVHQASIEDAPNGKAFYRAQFVELERFCQAGRAEIEEGLAHLQRCRLILPIAGIDADELFIDIELPMSDLDLSDRKRFKATPDQLANLVHAAGYQCAACGEANYSMEGWHVDHIIPRSVGGADVEINCQVLCDSCNMRKGARVHWVDFLGGRR